MQFFKKSVHIFDIYKVILKIIRLRNFVGKHRKFWIPVC